MKKHLYKFYLSIMVFLLSAAILPLAGRNIAAADENAVSTSQAGDYIYDINADGTVTITDWNGSDSDLVIPAELDGMTVSGIGYRSFALCRQLNSIVFPSSVETIAEDAFAGCDSLTKVTLPSSLREIHPDAFWLCSVLSVLEEDPEAEYFTVVDNVLYDGDMKKLVTYPEGLRAKSFEIPDGVETIGDKAFCLSLYLETVEIPSSVTAIGDFAFHGCDHLQSIHIPESVRSVGKMIFMFCNRLTDVEISGTDTVLGEGLIYGCENLSRVVLSPDNSHYRTENGLIIDNDNHSVFCCPPAGEIKAAVIPDDVVSVGSMAFSFCEGIKTVSFPDSLESIGEYAFYRCKNLKEIAVPDSVNELGENVFGSCKSLKAARLPNGLTSISRSLFKGSGIESVDFPDTVEAIEDRAFSGCKSLTEIYLPESLSFISDSAFEDCREDLVFNFEPGSYAEYYCRLHGRLKTEVGAENG